MAETITYRVTINPRSSTVAATAVDGGTVHDVILDTTNALTVRSILNEIQNGGLDANSKTSLSTIAAMLVAGTANYDATNAAAVATLLTEILAGTDVSAVVTAIDGL
jgi:hypothetical protein